MVVVCGALCSVFVFLLDCPRIRFSCFTLALMRHTRITSRVTRRTWANPLLHRRAWESAGGYKESAGDFRRHPIRWRRKPVRIGLWPSILEVSMCFGCHPFLVWSRLVMLLVRLRCDPLRGWCNAYRLWIVYLLLGTSKLLHASLVFLT